MQEGGGEPISSTNCWASSSPTPYSLYFEVEDTGSGIAADDIETLFDPFVQTKSGQLSLFCYFGESKIRGKSRKSKHLAWLPHTAHLWQQSPL
jgi:hypothetical protein